ncbi:MAG TPA: hypothetical protein VK200_03090, partial [Candidatus Limnocylindrales bacterium]|nr:hypothetical protein [Candidatus Limnocylindrales bacterium]
MEGEVNYRPLARPIVAILASVLIDTSAALTMAQDKVANPGTDAPEINLRKSINTRLYQGREVEGEDRQIGRGDSLWRILVEEKGVSGKQFRSYVVIIRGLNPHVKNLDVLQVGDKIFIPLRPTQLLEGRAAEIAAGDRIPPGSGIINYRVKAGEHLYQILREQLKVTDDRKVAQYYALVRDLNPERKNWDALLEGEMIRLPVPGRADEIPATVAAPAPSPRAGSAPTTTVEAKSAVAPAPIIELQTKPAIEPDPSLAIQPPVTVDRREVLRLPAKENLALVAKVAESMGSQMQQSGEEVIDLKEGAVRFDKRNYPVVFNPLLNQRVVLDPENKIPPSLRTKLADPSVGAPIVPMANGVSIQDAVGQLLAGLGYQALPTDRPVIIQEDGIAYEARGSWMALAPEESNKPQQVYVINLSDEGSEIPEYLRALLVQKGLHLKDISLSPTTASQKREDKSTAKSSVSPAKIWPRDKKDLVDNLLFAFGIPFGVAETLSVELQNGLRFDART